MTTYISLLRGINLGAHYKIKMPDLTALYESLGLTNVQTYVQSGNVVFTSEETDHARLEEAIKAKIEEVYGYNVPILVLAAEELRRIAQANPFLTERNANPAHLHVTFLAAPPDAERVRGFVPPKSGEDEFILAGRAIYLLCPNGYGQTKLTNNLFENKWKVQATTRNWRTVSALVEMVS
ncbi:MAG TPA: DUF1697 domain-containing protein [Anaerolineales bacterium]|nr:DUF1697 domain-containing protein [Anaerolineales bacterium]